MRYWVMDNNKITYFMFYATEITFLEGNGTVISSLSVNFKYCSTYWMVHL